MYFVIKWGLRSNDQRLGLHTVTDRQFDAVTKLTPPHPSKKQVIATVSLRDPTESGKVLAEGDGLFYVRKPPPYIPVAEELESRPCDDYGAVGPGGEKINAETTLRFKHCFSYDEAIRHFGRGNPDAETNVVAFYGGDVTAVRAPRAQRAKL